MPDIYTSLTRAKMELNGGILPAMTPLSGEAALVLDPAFTPGMGALEEHPELGLRCPIRGCGRYYHRLFRHLSISPDHQGFGGHMELKRLLGIPPSVALWSSRAAETAPQTGCSSEEMRKLRQARGPRPASEAKRVAALKGVKSSVGTRNFRNSCEAQIKQRLLAVYEKTGRSPSLAEAKLADPTLMSAAVTVFGSWNNAKIQSGLEPYFRTHGRNKTYSRNQVLAALGTWYDVHGRLPRVHEAQNPSRLPLIPQVRTIFRQLGEKSWPKAMCVAARELGLIADNYYPQMSA